jgi:hypothetical protein
VAPFTAARMGLWLTTSQRFGCGHASRLRWSVDTERVPVTLLLLAALGHPADVRWYALAAAGVSLHPMILAGLGHTDHLLS